MKNGFTLLELLVVILIVSIATASTVIVFSNIDDDTNIIDRQNIYKDIQRGAILYVDLNDEWLNQFRTQGVIYIELGELKNTNYVSSDLYDPVTNDEIPSNYLIQIYVAKDTYGTEYLNSCIIDRRYLQTTPGDSQYCIANENGLSENCCIN